MIVDESYLALAPSPRLHTTRRTRDILLDKPCLHSTASLVDSDVCGCGELEIQCGGICITAMLELGRRYIVRCVKREVSCRL